MKRNTDLVAKAVAHHRRYCMSCGTRLAQVSSRRAGLCQACRRHCVCCGQETGVYGHYDVCLRCRPVIDKSIEHMKRHHGHLPSEGEGENKPSTLPRMLRRESCVSCGDPAEFVFDGRPYCAECHAEKEGAPPCTNCGDPNCAGECERDESDQT